MTFSVIIPLYNKEAEVGRALRSVLSQSLPPLEIVVVDDGSTDGSAAMVEAAIAEIEAGGYQITGMGDATGAGDVTGTETDAVAGRDATGTDAVAGRQAPRIELIRQKNAGETAARNRGMAAARGDYFALIDADDEWRPGFLAEIAGLIEQFPDCGLYCTAFDIVRDGTAAPGRTPSLRGPVAEYFREAMSGFVATASSSVLSRAAVAGEGGFPEGMRLGGDQYMWTRIARKWPVCFSPERLAVIHASAANRSAAIYRPEVTGYSFEDFYVDGAAPGSADFWMNEYIARTALGKAIVASAKGDSAQGRRTERFFARNRHSRRLWWRLWILNRLPERWRPALHAAYASLAWRIAKRGL